MQLRLNKISAARVLVLLTGIFCANVYANSLEDKKVSLGKHEISYYKTGQGSSIVLLPGFGVTRNFWSKSMVECLSQQHTLYIIDYPELTPKSASIKFMAKKVNRIIEALKLDHPQIMGLSIGGAVALELAYDYPHSNSGLILIAPVVPNKNEVTGLKSNHPIFSSQDAELRDLFQHNLYQYDSSTFNYYKEDTLFPGKALRTDAEQSKLQMQAIQTWNTTGASKIGHIPIKADVFIVAKDTMLDPQIQIDMFKYYTNKSITILDGTGHAAFFDAGEDICLSVLKK